MDRPSQEPPEPPESPLSFPVEAPRPDDVEPGAGAPLDPPAQPLLFPVAEAPGPPGEPEPPELLPFAVAELPGTPPAPEPEPEPREPEPEPRPTAPRFVPAVLTTLATLLAAGGCFLPLFRIQQHVNARQQFFEAELSITQTAWGSTIEIPGQETAERLGAPVGVPLLLAVVLLAAAALTAFSRPGRAARWLVGAGAVFTAGVVLTVGMSGFEWSELADGEDLEVVVAAGMWSLIAAAVLAAGAAVVTALPLRRGSGGDWADPALAYADTPTPPTGVAITVLPPEEPDEPEEPEEPKRPG